MGVVFQLPVDAATGTTIADEMSPRSHDDELLGRGSLVGRYVTIDLLGRGGMGVVYAAYDPELDRRVAIKLVHTRAIGDQSAGRARLAREAQALAKLQHPNVVAVHDVGAFENHLFVAMELVEGVTLATWLASSPRTASEVIATFVQAGQGLAAAHASGIVHRDFKPQNVLIDRESRVRVADFGLARVAAEPEAQPVDDAARTQTEITSANRSAHVTRTGAFLGTPAYASPEQLLGRATDARSDQFSFSVSLYEALYGERPFAGDAEAEILGAILDGAVRPAPASSRVPKRLREIVLRGLHADPERRHASMEALLAELRRQPAALRRALVGAAAVALTTIVFIVGAARGRAAHAGICEHPTRRLAGIWDASRKDSMRAAFRRGRQPYAGDALATVERLLDAYATQWTNAFGDACTGADREEPEAYLRVACLTQLADEMRAQSDLLAQADEHVIENGARMVQSLPPIERCSKAGVLALPPPPAASLRAPVDEMRRQLAQARALGASGRYVEGLSIAMRVADASHSLGYPPALAEALFERGVLEDGAGQLDRAAHTLDEAALAAEASRHDRLLAETLVQSTAVSDERSRYDEAHADARRAFAAIQRLGGDDVLRARLLNRIGNVYWHQGRLDDAIAAHRDALALAERSLPAQDRDLAWIQNDLGVVLVAASRYDEALPYLERARMIKEATLGATHPDVGRTLNNIGWVEMMRGNLPKAAVDTLHALAIEERALGAGHPDVASARCSAAAVLLAQGDFETARAYAERALAVMEKKLGPRHPSLVEPLTLIGQALLGERRPREAIAPLERALALPQGHFAVGDERADTRAALARAKRDANANARTCDRKHSCREQLSRR